MEIETIRISINYNRKYTSKCDNEVLIQLKIWRSHISSAKSGPQQVLQWHLDSPSGLQQPNVATIR